MASPGFLAWLDKQRALRRPKAAIAPATTTVDGGRSDLPGPHVAAAAASPSPSDSSAQTAQDPQKHQGDDDEQKPRAPPETPPRALDTQSPPPERRRSLDEQVKPQPSKKRPRAPPHPLDSPADSPATPPAAVRSPTKRLKLANDAENKERAADGSDLARDRPRGLRERPAAASEPTEKAVLTELRTPIPVPTLLPLDATVDWDLGDVSSLIDASTSQSSMLLGRNDKAELERPLHSSDFSFWRAVDRFYDLDED